PTRAGAGTGTYHGYSRPGPGRRRSQVNPAGPSSRLLHLPGASLFGRQDIQVQGFQVADNIAGNLAGRRRSGRDRDATHAAQPFGIDVRDAVDEARGTAGNFLHHLHEAVGVVAALVADDQNEIRVAPLVHGGFLALLGGEAQVVVDLGVRETLEDVVDDALGVPLAQSGLGGHRDFVRIDLERIHVGLGFNQVHAVGRLADDAL